MYVLEAQSTRSIERLADLSADGAKEAFAERVCGAGANCMFPEIITTMVQCLQQQGFNGWVSPQNSGDRRCEVCLFHVPQGLVINRCYAFGP